MLAYVFWHWKRADIPVADYEERLAQFHLALRASPSPGLTGSACLAITGAPWANDGRDAYEDWYLLGSSADLDPLNDAAVSAARQWPHDQAASAAAGGTAGLYRLRAGTASSSPRQAWWFAKPDGWSYSLLHERLRSLTDAGAGLWGRQMTLGPAREFCLHTSGPVQLPVGLDATCLDLRAVFPRGV